MSWSQKYGTGIRHLPNQVVKPIFFFSVASLTFMKMDRLIITQHIIMIKIYYKSGTYATAMYRTLRGVYGLRNRSTTQAISTTTQTISTIVKKFEETGMITNIERPVRHCIARSTENISIVNKSDSLSFSGIRTVLRHIFSPKE